LNSSDRHKNSDYSRLFISLGEKDGFYKAAFLEFLLDTSGHKKAQLGKIELMDSYSFVEVENAITEEFIACFNGKKFRGRAICIEVSSDRTGGGSKGRKGGFGGRSRGGDDRRDRGDRGDRGPRGDRFERSDRSDRGGRGGYDNRSGDGNRDRGSKGGREKKKFYSK